MRSSKSRGNTSTDKSVNLNNGGFVAQGGSTINVTDGGAVSAAFDFGGEVITSYENLADGAVTLVEDVVTDSLSFGRNALSSVTSNNTQMLNQVGKLVEQVKAGEEQDSRRFEMGMVLVLVFVIIAILVFLYARGKK